MIRYEQSCNDHNNDHNTCSRLNSCKVLDSAICNSSCWIIYFMALDADRLSEETR